MAALISTSLDTKGQALMLRRASSRRSARRLPLPALRARLLTLRRRDSAVVIGVLRIEPCEHQPLELLLSDRRRRREQLLDDAPHHPCAPTATAIIVASALRRLELCQRLIGFGACHRAVVIAVDHLEHHVRALLRFRAKSDRAVPIRHRRREPAPAPERQ